MHFVSSQTEAEQISDIVSFFVEHMPDAIERTTPAFNGFEAKLAALNKARDYKGMLAYFLTLKAELLSLPTSHKNSQLTIQRAILMVLPLLKTQEVRA